MALPADGLGQVERTGNCGRFWAGTKRRRRGASKDFRRGRVAVEESAAGRINLSRLLLITLVKLKCVTRVGTKKFIPFIHQKIIPLWHSDRPFGMRPVISLIPNSHHNKSYHEKMKRGMYSINIVLILIFNDQIVVCTRTDDPL